MPAELSMKMKPKQSQILFRLTTKMKPNIRQALVKAGAILEGQIKEHLSGPGFTRNPNRSSPYPGILSGTLRSSVHFKLESNGLTVHVGPGGAARKYAAIHEFGGMAGRGHSTYIPARPYVFTAWKKKQREVMSAIQKELMRGI